jgi:valyl-tRNA synthetase
MSAAAQRGTRQTLVRVLETSLRLLHPIMPFITEELWQKVAPLAGKSGKTIMLQPYPQPESAKIDNQALQEIEWVKQFILGVRRIRAEMDIAPGKALPVLLQNGSAEDQRKLNNCTSLLTRLARLETITWLNAQTTAPESAIALVGELRILIPLAGLIDKDAELKRLQKEMGKLHQELEKCQTKLNNPNFLTRAPQEIIDKEQQRVAEMNASLQQLNAQADRIRTI